MFASFLLCFVFNNSFWFLEMTFVFQDVSISFHLIFLDFKNVKLFYYLFCYFKLGYLICISVELSVSVFCALGPR